MTNKIQGIEKDFFQLARIALSGRPQDIQSLLYRVVKRENGKNSDLSKMLSELLRKAPTRSSPLRKSSDRAMPVDIDSRFQLLRIEEEPVLNHEPVYAPDTQQVLDQIILERRNFGKLLEVGLEPTRTAIFTGPPGVGKTMAARWLARELGRPLLILDLSSVMSSFLGRTGTNLRHVLEYAKTMECVLLLDELDAIAKRRDDSSEIGELKRLVTVLIQQLDDWPSTGLLLAATNHADLLDPAIWRRFEASIEFALPNIVGAKAFINEVLTDVVENSTVWADILSAVFAGKSYSDIERDIVAARRSAVLNGGKVDEHLMHLVESPSASKEEKINLAVMLVQHKLVTQRKAHELTGISRDTIRSHLKKMGG